MYNCVDGKADDFYQCGLWFGVDHVDQAARCNKDVVSNMQGSV